jgi:SprT-like family
VRRPRGHSKRVPGGDRIFQRIFTRLGCQGRPPQFLVEFHPYAGLTHTVRLRGETAHVRLSDVLRRAPIPVIESAAAILLGRLYRRRPPADLLDVYREFAHSTSTRTRIMTVRRRRARPLELHPAGSHHDLHQMYQRLNERYFNGALPYPRLGWSKRCWHTQLGCFDPALNQIVINQLLDRREVPDYVVAYVLYHEMLHQKHPVKFERCRRESHSAAFRREERQFSDYARAMKFLKQFGAGRRRRIGHLRSSAALGSGRAI